MTDRILSLVAMLAGGVVELPARAEVPIADDTDADVFIVASIRNGRVTLSVHYEVALAHEDQP